MGCKLLFLKALEGKVAPNLKIKGHNLGVCGGKVPSWRADLCVLAACAGFSGIESERNFVCRWSFCNVRIFHLDDTDEDEMLQVFISQMTFQLG